MTDLKKFSFLFPIKRRWLKILLYIIAPTIILIYLIINPFFINTKINTLILGESSSLLEIQRIAVGPKDFVVYRYNCESKCDFGLSFVQERHLLPGITWDRVTLGSYDHAVDVKFRKTGTCSVMIDSISGHGNEKLIPKDLQYRLCGGAQTEYKTISEIYKMVEEIDNTKNFSIKKLDNEYFLNQGYHPTDNGREMTGYFNETELVKLTERIGLSFAMTETTYYFSDGNLIYVNLKENDYPYDEAMATLDTGNTQLVYEARYYFVNNKLYTVNEKGKRNINYGSNLETEEALLNSAIKNKVILSK